MRGRDIHGIHGVRIAIGAVGVSGPIGPIVAHMLGLVLVTGTRLAAPVVTALLLVEIVMGLIARAAPQLNLLVVGTPVRLLVGMLALSAGIQVVPGVVAGRLAVSPSGQSTRAGADRRNTSAYGKPVGTSSAQSMDLLP